MWPFTQLHPPTVALWGDATKSAESWGKTEVEKIANEKKQFLSTSDAAMRAEQWALNKALHYNAWANFGKNDLVPVVAAFKELLEGFRCSICDSKLIFNLLGQIRCRLICYLEIGWFRILLNNRATDEAAAPELR